MHERGPRGGLDLRVAGARGPVADVVGEGLVEEDRLLQDHADPVAEVGQGQAADRHAVEADLAPGRVVEPHQEVDQGALAAPGRPDQRDLHPGLDPQPDVPDDRLSRLISEADPVELDQAAGPADPRGVGGPGDVGFEVEDFPQPVDAGGRLLEDVGQVGQPGHRAEQEAGQGGRRDDPAGGHPAPRTSNAPAAKTAAVPVPLIAALEVREGRREPVVAHPEDMRVGELCGEVVDLGRLSGEGLDHQGAVELLLEVAEEHVHLGRGPSRCWPGSCAGRIGSSGRRAARRPGPPAASRPLRVSSNAEMASVLPMSVRIVTVWLVTSVCKAPTSSIRREMIAPVGVLS
ncbi:MAG: hypothetical protein WKG06_20590 [Segetibacter sp.]